MATRERTRLTPVVRPACGATSNGGVRRHAQHSDPSTTPPARGAPSEQPLLVLVLVLVLLLVLCLLLQPHTCCGRCSRVRRRRRRRPTRGCAQRARKRRATQ